MNARVRHWLHGLGSATIGGAATSVTALAGTSIAHSIGVNVNALDLKQTGAVAIAGAIFTTAAYLKQSPLPPESNGDTEIKIKNEKITTS